MVRSFIHAGVLLGALLAGAGAAFAQNVPDAPAPRPADSPRPADPRSTDSQSAPKRASPAPKNTPNPASPPTSNSPQSPQSPPSDNNAFPEDQSKKAAADAAPDSSNTNSKSTLTDDNAFPEEKSKAAAKAAGAPDEDTPGTSSSRSSTSDGSAAADLPRQGDVAIAPDPKAAAKDVQVGKFYLDSRDYKGAYARFKHAGALSPEDPAIIFLIAESARRLNRLDEAAQNYKLCLQLDPDGPQAKAARRALAEFDKLASR